MPNWRLVTGNWQLTALLAATHFLLALLVFDPAPYTGGDNAVYLSLARSLAEGRGYRDLYLPGAPAHLHFPPAFPAFLAIATLLGLRSLVALKLLIVLASTAAVAASYQWLRHACHRNVALGAGIILAVGPGILFWTHWVLSDIPFWLLTVVALAIFERREAPRGLPLALGCAAVFLAFFTRAAGVALVVSLVIWLAMRNRRALALFLGLLLPALGAWYAWIATHGGGLDTLGWLRDPYDPGAGRISPWELPGRAAENLRSLILMRLPLLLHGSTSTVGMIAALGLVGLAIFWWIRRLRAPRLADLFLPIYVAMLLAWPAVWADDRFLLPVLPILLGFAGQMGRVATLDLAPALRRSVRLGAPAVLLLLGLPTLARGVEQSVACNARVRAGERYPCLPDEWHAFYLVAEASAARLPADAVVISRKPELFHALSGRRGVLYPYTTDPDTLLRLADGIGARYVVVDQVSNLAQRFLGPALAAHPDRFCVRGDLTLEHAMMLEIVAEPPPRTAGPPRVSQDSTEVVLRTCG